MFCLNKNKNDEKLFCLHTKKLNGKKAKCKNEKGKCFSHFPWSVHFSKTFRYLPIPLPILFPKAPANGKIHAICIPLNETNKMTTARLTAKRLMVCTFWKLLLLFMNYSFLYFQNLPSAVYVVKSKTFANANTSLIEISESWFKWISLYSLNLRLKVWNRKINEYLFFSNNL